MGVLIMNVYRIILSGVSPSGLTPLIYKDQLDLRNSCAWSSDQHFTQLTGCINNPIVVSFSGFSSSIILSIKGDIRCIKTLLEYLEVLLEVNCANLRAELLPISIT